MHPHQHTAVFHLGLGAVLGILHAHNPHQAALIAHIQHTCLGSGRMAELLHSAC